MAAKKRKTPKPRRKNTRDPLPVRKTPVPGIEMPPKPAGRPTVLTKELGETICGFLEETNSLEDSARLVGLHPSTAHAWKRKGKLEPDGPYGWFYEAVENAVARRRLMFHRAFRQHWGDSHQAVLAHAERTDPKHFALRVRLEVNEELEAALEILRTGLPPDQYETVLALVARGLGGAEAGDDPIDTPGDSDEAGGQLGSPPSVDPPAAVPEPGD